MNTTPNPECVFLDGIKAQVCGHTRREPWIDGVEADFLPLLSAFKAAVLAEARAEVDSLRAEVERLNGRLRDAGNGHQREIEQHRDAVRRALDAEARLDEVLSVRRRMQTRWDRWPGVGPKAFRDAMDGIDAAMSSAADSVPPADVPLENPNSGLDIATDGGPGRVS